MESDDPERISVEACCEGGQGSPRAVAPFDDDGVSYFIGKPFPPKGLPSLTRTLPVGLSDPGV